MQYPDKKPTLPMNVRPMDETEDKENSLVSSRLFAHLDKMLTEWKDHRKAAIEWVWEKAYENFNGHFDDNNKDSNSRSLKRWRSRAFYPLTEQKVTGAQAQLQDILFKGGRFPYDIKGSPIPDDPAMLASNEAVAMGEILTNHIFTRENIADLAIPGGQKHNQLAERALQSYCHSSIFALRFSQSSKINYSWFLYCSYDNIFHINFCKGCCYVYTIVDSTEFIYKL